MLVATVELDAVNVPFTTPMLFASTMLLLSISIALFATLSAVKTCANVGFGGNVIQSIPVTVELNTCPAVPG